LVFLGVLVCLVSLVVAPLWVSGVVDKIIGTARLGAWEVAPEEEARALAVQATVIGLFFLIVAFGLERLVTIRGHVLAFWLANPVGIVAGVLLFRIAWLGINVDLPIEFALRTRAFHPPSEEQLYILCSTAAFVSLLASWAGAQIAFRLR
jgi:hypothetical protein